MANVPVRGQESPALEVPSIHRDRSERKSGRGVNIETDASPRPALRQARAASRIRWLARSCRGRLVLAGEEAGHWC